PVADGGGKSPDRPGGVGREIDPAGDLRALSGFKDDARPAGRRPERGTTAAAGDRPRACRGPQAPAARRADRGDSAVDHQRDRRRDPEDQSRGEDGGPAGGAIALAGPGDRRFVLRDGKGGDRGGRPGRKIDRRGRPPLSDGVIGLPSQGRVARSPASNRRRNGKNASDAAGAGEAPDLHGGPARQGAAGPRAEAELSGGGGADHLGGPGGDPGRKAGLGADGERKKDPLPRRRHGGGAGDDQRDPGGGDLPRRDQAGDDPRSDSMTTGGKMIPGEYFIADGEIEANAGRRTVALTVTHTGDRPVQVGSHFHFFEVNRALSFDRGKGFGMRLNIPSGSAVRFEPGEKKRVVLVALGGE